MHAPLTVFSSHSANFFARVEFVGAMVVWLVWTRVFDDADWKLVIFVKARSRECKPQELFSGPLSADVQGQTGGCRAMIGC